MEGPAVDERSHSFSKKSWHQLEPRRGCNHEPTQQLQVCMDAAVRGGIVCVVSVMFANAQITPATLNFKEVWLTGAYSNTHDENRQCLQWMAEGKLDGRPMISDLISLDQLPDVYEKRIHPGKTIKVMVDMEL